MNDMSSIRNRHGILPTEHPYGMQMVMGIPNGCGCFLVFFYRHGNLPIEHPYRDADDYGIFPTDRASLTGCGGSWEFQTDADVSWVFSTGMAIHR